jgi:hypothetical protein
MPQLATQQGTDASSVHDNAAGGGGSGAHARRVHSNAYDRCRRRMSMAASDDKVGLGAGTLLCVRWPAHVVLVPQERRSVLSGLATCPIAIFI